MKNVTITSKNATHTNLDGCQEWTIRMNSEMVWVMENRFFTCVLDSYQMKKLTRIN